jgi:hypothetical protein
MTFVLLFHPTFVYDYILVRYEWTSYNYPILVMCQKMILEEAIYGLVYSGTVVGHCYYQANPVKRLITYLQKYCILPMQ